MSTCWSKKPIYSVFVSKASLEKGQRKYNERFLNDFYCIVSCILPNMNYYMFALVDHYESSLGTCLTFSPWVIAKTVDSLKFSCSYLSEAVSRCQFWPQNDLVTNYLILGPVFKILSNLFLFYSFLFLYFCCYFVSVFFNCPHASSEIYENYVTEQKFNWGPPEYDYFVSVS